MSDLIINGINLSELEDKTEAGGRSFKVPPATVVPGRIAHIDADFLAYEVSAQSKYDAVPKSLDDMQHNCRERVRKMLIQSGSERVYLHLTPGTSDKGLRYGLAIQKEYQANRKDKEKPQYLHIMRDWMAKTFPGKLHQNCEADDGMSSSQYACAAAGINDKSIILSKDKDLRMVPGWHMDWDTGEVTHVQGFGELWFDDKQKLRGNGHKWFWAQMIMGDSADNIQGLPCMMNEHMTKPKRVGPAAAYSLLNDITNAKDAFQFVKKLYEDTGIHVGFKHWQTGESVPWQRVFVSEAQLLWMRKEPANQNCVINYFKECA